MPLPFVTSFSQQCAAMRSNAQQCAMAMLLPFVPSNAQQCAMATPLPFVPSNAQQGAMAMRYGHALWPCRCHLSLAMRSNALWPCHLSLASLALHTPFCQRCEEAFQILSGVCFASASPGHPHTDCSGPRRISSTCMLSSFSVDAPSAVNSTPVRDAADNRASPFAVSVALSSC